MNRIIFSCAALPLLLAVAPAAAQSYPAKPIRMVIGFPPGGGTDIVGRIVAQKLGEALKQQIVTDNRGGASGQIAAELVAKMPPDGYTLMMAHIAAMSILPSLQSKLPYDPQRDFALVGFIANTVTGLFVNATLPAKSVQELVAYLKANPGKLNYGSSGVGQRFHLSTELFQRRTGTSIVHIPYKGAAQFLPELLAGRIDLIFFPPVENLMSQVKAGKLRLLAMATNERFPDFPDVPTLAEAGVPNFNVPDYTAVAFAAGTPKDIINRLNRELARAVHSPNVRKAFADTAFVPITSTPEEAAQIVDRDVKTWGPLLKSFGIKPD